MVDNTSIGWMHRQLFLSLAYQHTIQIHLREVIEVTAGKRCRDVQSAASPDPHTNGITLLSCSLLLITWPNIICSLNLVNDPRLILQVKSTNPNVFGLNAVSSQKELVGTMNRSVKQPIIRQATNVHSFWHWDDLFLIWGYRDQRNVD
jgi:hypothetical protein